MFEAARVPYMYTFPWTYRFVDPGVFPIPTLLVNMIVTVFIVATLRDPETYTFVLVSELDT